jgi:cell division protein FtsW
VAVRERDAAAVRSRGRLRSLLARHDPGPWGRNATTITLLAALLLVVGLVMSFSASFVDAAEVGDPFGVFKRQAAWAAIGVPAFALVANLEHRVWRRAAWFLLVGALAGLVIVLIPGIGLERFGSRRWIGVGPLVVQPSEVAKLATLLWLADVMVRKRAHLRPNRLDPDGTVRDLRHLLVPAVPLLFVQAVLLMLEPDLGTTIMVALIVGLVLWVEGLPMRIIAAFGMLGVVLIGAATAVAPYRMARVTGWLHPEDDPLGNGYQLLQSLFALGSGRWFGIGLGSSRGKWNYIPNPETDFIFAIIGEELGLVGALTVLALFGALLVVGLRVARSSADPFARIVALGITGWVVGQALINICTVTGILPITGVTLPLLSVGGSSLVATLVALGILVSIARSVDGQDPAARTTRDGRVVRPRVWNRQERS